MCCKKYLNSLNEEERNRLERLKQRARENGRHKVHSPEEARMEDQTREEVEEATEDICIVCDVCMLSTYVNIREIIRDGCYNHYLDPCDWNQVLLQECDELQMRKRANAGEYKCKQEIEAETQLLAHKIESLHSALDYPTDIEETLALLSKRQRTLEENITKMFNDLQKQKNSLLGTVQRTFEKRKRSLKLQQICAHNVAIWESVTEPQPKFSFEEKFGLGRNYLAFNLGFFFPCGPLREIKKSITALHLQWVGEEDQAPGACC
ncbi:hypothetical protein Pelo_6232 [Pelomyxa schiedti]|nr:hypothetical protein Pelo_6232 [Pelomyxa schiedti]